MQGETDPAQDQHFDAEVAKMGLRGLSVLVASGDDGVAGSNARGNKAGCGFNPSYPASCPHVTAVGATQGPESDATEVSVGSCAGGGRQSHGHAATHVWYPVRATVAAAV